MNYTTTRQERVIDEITEQFGTLLRTWVDQATDSDTISLAELEQDVRTGLHALGAEVLQGLVDLIGTGKTTDAVVCPHCGGSLTFVRYQGKWVQTLLGPIRPERAYFHCAACQQGHVPLDQQLGLGPDTLSGGLEETLCLLAACMPLEEAVDKLERLLLVRIDDNPVQRAVLRVGSVLAARQEQQTAQVWQQAEPPPLAVAEPPARLYISVDGTTAHLQEGWKEVKVAALYETAAVPQADGTTAIRAVDTTYVVSFADAETFAQHVYVAAARRGLHQAAEVVVLGDGAAWIWHRIADFCDAPVEIVDFYHASEHVWHAGQALYGAETAATEQWVTQRLHELRHEGVDILLTSLEQAAAEAPAAVQTVLNQEFGYFSNHRQRMRYPELAAAGYHIGSGSVESACKRIIGARLKQAGMIWSRPGAQAMAHLRATVLSQQWDEFWASYDRTRRSWRQAA